MSHRASATLIGVTLALGVGQSLGACGEQELRVPITASGGADASSGGVSSASGSPEAGEAEQKMSRADPFERPRELGAACTSNGDCGAEGLTCLRADHDLGLELGAVPGGVCTRACKTDVQCRAFGSGAVCATLAEVPLALDLGSIAAAPRYCMAGCALGAPGGASKCHARDTMACRPFAPPQAQRCATTAPACPNGLNCFRGYCRELACGPRCNGDADCAPGRFCDALRGLCTQSAGPVTPIGMFCDPDAPSTPCGGGSCLVLFDENNVKVDSFCTQSCVLGARCGDGRGACQLPRFGNYEVGDIGYCQPVCDCNADCEAAGEQCYPWGDVEAEQHYGSKGACRHTDGEDSLKACRGAGAPD